MVPQRIRRFVNDARGVTLAELLVVIAILGVILGIAIPPLWTYYRAAALRAAGEQTVSLLNGARQLAIRMNTTVCVRVDANGMRYHIGSCIVPGAWTGPGTDSAGYMRLDQGLTFDIAASANNLCFNYLGAGTTAPAPCAPNGTLTITRAQGGTLNVIMATTGRVRLQ